MDIILTNGAPFSGKDTLVKKILEYFGEQGIFMRFKNPLYRRFAKRHNLTLEQTIEICSGPGKDQPCDLIGGKIPRQELIDISENHIKVERGENGVALEVIDEMLDTEEHGRKTFVFPDGGFEYERKCFNLLLKRFGLTKVFVIRIVRDGYTFESVGDSRSYLKDPDTIIDNNVDESNLSEEERGEHMFQQFKTWWENK